MRRSVFSLGLAAALLCALALVPASPASAQKGGKGGNASAATTFPVTGTGKTAAGVPVNFAGTLAISQFGTLGESVVAVATLSGTVTDAAGTVVGTVSNLKLTDLALIGGSASGDCQILHLELGPLDLDLLGLQVHLDKVVLDITAQPGEGNLLGNLLCAIAGLLDPGAGVPLNIIADLLNSLLDLLNFLR
jgi:hypothetical protein